MSETGIAMRTRALHRDRRNHVSAVGACATCKGNRDLCRFDQSAGFCRDCLDRSRIDDDDDLGGEG